MTSHPSSTTTRPRVVIIGSGFGGLFAARALKRTAVDVTLIARTTHHLFQPLLYQVATGIMSQGEVSPATREILSRNRNTQIVLGEVCRIDLDTRVVTATTDEDVHDHHYDFLIVAAGTEQTWFGHDQFAVHAPGLKSIDDALELRGRIFGSFERAERAAAEGRHDDVRRLTTFAVVGAGATGVEMAGQLVELSRRTLRRDFRHIDTTRASVVLLDTAPTVLGNFAPSLQQKAARSLQSLGVELRLGTTVVGVDADGIDTQDASGAPVRISAATKVWAAGVVANPLAGQLADQVGVEVDHLGRIPVQPDLTLPDHPEVHVVGDMAALDDLPGVAQVAIQGARHSATAIKQTLRAQPADAPFRYWNKGNMATISRFRAIAEVGRIKVTGLIAWLMWLLIHLIYTVGFKSRITTVLHWMVSFLGRARAERTATEHQTVGRLAQPSADRLSEART